MTIIINTNLLKHKMRIMKTRYYYLIFPLLLCLSQMLHAQDKPVKPIEPNEKLNAGASVTKQLVYHDAGRIRQIITVSQPWNLCCSVSAFPTFLTAGDGVILCRRL